MLYNFSFFSMRGKFGEFKMIKFYQEAPIRLRDPSYRVNIQTRKLVMIRTTEVDETHKHKNLKQIDLITLNYDYNKQKMDEI